MKNMTSCAKAILCVGGVLLSVAAHAAPDDNRAMGIYVEAGNTPQSVRSTNSLTAGLTLPMGTNRVIWGGDVGFYWDFFLSGWRAPKPTGNAKDNYAQIGAIANWRYRFGEGRSPWFAEAGIGGTLMDHLYRTENGREFSTAFQFTEQIGAGLSFGAQREHEVSVRLQHFSNGHIKEPNPGENFVRVRYLYRF